MELSLPNSQQVFSKELMNLRMENTQLQDLYQKSQSILLKSIQESQRQAEVIARLSAIVNLLSDKMPKELLNQVLEDIEWIKMMPIDKLLNNLSKMGKIPNSTFPSVSDDDPIDLKEISSLPTKRARPESQSSLNSTVSNSTTISSEINKNHNNAGSPTSIPELTNVMSKLTSQMTRTLIPEIKPPEPISVKSMEPNEGKPVLQNLNSNATTSDQKRTYVYQREENNENGSNGDCSEDDLPPSSPSSYGVIRNRIVNSSTSDRHLKSPTKRSVTEEASENVPRGVRVLNTLPHGDVVCAVAIHPSSSLIYTGGKGSIKLWDITSSSKKSLANLYCLADNFVRACKISEDGNTLVVAGETNVISIWDLQGSTTFAKCNLQTSAPACYALALDLNNSNQFFSCYSDNTIGLWDIRIRQQCRIFSGHTDGVSCANVSPDGTKLLSGSLDSSLRVWDLIAGRELSCYNFDSQIFCLSICPGESWVALGMENNLVEVLNMINPACKYQLHLHQGCVLSVKYSNSSKWLVTAGKDKQLNIWRSPFGNTNTQVREQNSILCCELSSEDTLMITGSGERLATVYEVLY